MNIALENKLYWYAMMLVATIIVMIFGAIFSVAIILSQPKSSRPPSCNDFGSYAQILKSFYAGNSALDGNDKDGIPCENRK